MQNNCNANPQGNQYKPLKPDSYLVWAILSTVCCCLPFGIVSIVYASKVDGLYRAGLYDEAQRASDDAKKWAIISAVVGFAASALYCIVMFGFSMIGVLAG